MRHIKKITIFIMVFMFLLMPFVQTNAAAASFSSPKPLSAPLKKVVPGISKADRNQVLKISEKYYKLSIAKASMDEKKEIRQLINWVPDFSGRFSNPDKAIQYSNCAVFLIGFTNLKGLYLALSSALLALDTKNASTANNLASSILSYYEDSQKKTFGSITKKDKSYGEDAAKVFEYAISIDSKGIYVQDSCMQTLINYGNLCIDLGKLDYAKALFETAVNIDPGYLQARQGMAAYWLAKGDKNRAKKELEKARLPYTYKKAKKLAEDTSDKNAPQVEETDDLGTMKDKIDKLSKVPTMLPTDFYENIDPEGTKKVKKFVDSIASKWKYTAPGIDYLTQYSTIGARLSGPGRAAYEAFKEILEEYAKKYAKADYTNKMNTMDNLGIGSVLGIDINDMINNPEKYKDLKIDKEKLKEAIQKQVQKAADGFISGGTSGMVSSAASVAPEFKIYQMNPGDYANPTDIVTQKYNITVLLRKINAYREYFNKQNKEITSTINDDIKNCTDKAGELWDEMENDLEALKLEHENMHTPPPDLDGARIYIPQESCDKCIIKIHEIHVKYYPQINHLIETAYMDATNFITTRYKQQLKSNIEAMYSDCMRNCMLISDPKIRILKEDEINDIVYRAVFNSLSNVANAYGIAPDDYPYICSCDQTALTEAKEREAKAQEEKDAEKTAMENRARKEFEAGIIKESSQLYKQLDKYSASLDFIFVHAKWTPFTTELKVQCKIPLNDKIGAFVNYNQVENDLKNTTTRSGCIGAEFKIGGNQDKSNNQNKSQKEDSPFKASVSVSIGAEVTTNGSGNVVQADVIGTAQASVTAGAFKASSTYEASVMRGCKFSSQVEEVFSESILTNKMLSPAKEKLKELSLFLPNKPKKVLWKGEYKVIN